VGAQTAAPSDVIKTVTPKRVPGFEVVKANYRVEEKPLKKNSVITTKQPKSAVDLNAPLVEERLYLDAINDLSQTVASSDEEVMRPSFRVEYEQNIALMDRAINKMQKQVRRNPNDENAKRILFASYQNKIDLLNTVAEKSQLMATLR
jgi:ribosomal protein S15P/S13E